MSFHFWFVAIDTIEKESFKVCDNDDDQSLTWEEVDSCVVRYDVRKLIEIFILRNDVDFQQTFGHFFKDLSLPTQDDFNEFDINQDGKLTYAEWYEKYQSL